MAQESNNTPQGQSQDIVPRLLEYDFNGHRVRVVMRGGEPWFFAKDVCAALGLNNVTEALRSLDDDEKSNISNPEVWNQPGRMPLIVSESGLYGLVLKSRRPEAKAFKRWVKHDVLPSIRKHGGYMMGQETMSPEEMVAASMRWLQSRIAEQKRQLEEQSAHIATLEPKATMLDEFTSVDGTMSVAQAAKDLSNTAGGPIGRDRLFALMEQWGWVYRDKAGRWVAYQAHVDAGHLVMKEHVASGVRKDGGRFPYPPTVRVTRKGLVLLRRKWCAMDEAKAVTA